MPNHVLHPAARQCLVAALAGVTLAGCSPRSSGPAVAERARPEFVLPSLDPRDTAGPEYSVYELSSEWRDQRGEARRLASLGGRVQLVAMVYTHCASTCPLVVADLKRIEAALAADGSPPVRSAGFVLVSLDPERDDPERLAEFARSTGLAPERWTLLAGSDDDVRELAAALDVKYRRTRDEEIDHSNVITVLDPAGGIVYQQAGLGGGSTATLRAVRQLLR